MLDTLGPYSIEQMIGRGGMGTVYAGRHQDTGQRAAIKVLSTILADDPNFRERFIAEIETLKKLNHPNIVRLFGDGEQDGHLFYVMELMDGQSLQAELQSGHVFEWKEVTAITLDICRALKHAHDRGVIHRDLKPANLLRSRAGQIKLTDFGIAKLFGGTHLTADGSVVGTADYMAPEQAEGKPITIRTDMYSLGTVMYTLLARRPPFCASSVAQVVHKLRYEEPASVRRFAPRVPGELEQIISELLRKAPNQRISNAMVLANRLGAIEQGTVTGAAVSLTQVSPTVVESPARPPDEYLWNEPTVITSDSPVAASADHAARPRGSDAGPANLPPARRNRFTTMDDHDREAGQGAPEQSGEESRHLRQTLPLVLALAALAGVTGWALWPASADQLYEQIHVTAAEDGWEGAKRYIDRFVRRFPDDHRWQEVEQLRMDVECEWLQSRLALRELKSGGSQLTDYQQQLLTAMRTMQQDRAAAAVSFRELLDRFGDRPRPEPELAECLRAARHLLRRTKIAHRGPAT